MKSTGIPTSLRAMTRASASSLLQKCTQAGTRQCELSILRDPSRSVFAQCTAWTPRLNTFLELKIENERLQHRIHELRAQMGQFVQSPSTSTVPALTASTLPPVFGGKPPSTTSSLSARFPIDPPPSIVPDHPESMAINPSPVTRNFDAAGFQEGDQGKPAKKKVRHVLPSDAVYIIT